MSCDLGELTERLENEQSSPTSELILQPFRRFTYVTAHSPILPLLHLRHSLFFNPSFASPTLQAIHLRHLASCPCAAVRKSKFLYDAKSYILFNNLKFYYL